VYECSTSVLLFLDQMSIVTMARLTRWNAMSVSLVKTVLSGVHFTTAVDETSYRQKRN
jgi:hypothetical protein